MGLTQLVTLVFATMLVACPATLADDNGTSIYSISNKIFGGMKAKNTFKFTGWIKLNGELICGASLYKQRWLITAAHCFEELGQTAETKDYRVLLGDFNRNIDDNEQQINFCNIMLHPDYDSTTKENNVAVVRLTRGAALTRDNIELVPRVQFNPIPDADLQAADCFLSGYGEDDGGDIINKRRKIDVNILPDAACNAIANYNAQTNLCYLTINSGPCVRDGGTPLTCILNGKQTQVGIHSFEPSGCTPGNQVASDTRQYRKFIKQTIDDINHSYKTCDKDKLQEKKGCGPEGQSFMVGYILPDPKESTPVLYITSTDDITVTLDADPSILALLPNTMFAVPAATGLKIELPDELTKEYVGLDVLGIRVSSDDDFFLAAGYEPDAIGVTYVFPEECLMKSSTQYLVASYERGYRNQIVIVGQKDGTVVTLHRPHLPSIQFTLDEFETYSYIAHEVTGIIVSGSKALSVFSGNKCGYIPEHVNYCDAIYEQMPPIHSLGDTYIIPRLLPRENILIRAVASVDGTTIIARNPDGTFLDSAVRDRGKFWEKQILNIPVVSVSSSEPILLAAYGIGGTVDLLDKGDPSMVIVPSVEQFAFMYKLYATGTTGHHRVAIIISWDADLSKLTLNGNPVTADFATEIVVVPSLGTYKIFYEDLVEGVNMVMTTGHIPFGVIQYLLEYYRETAASPKCLSIDPPVSP